MQGYVESSFLAPFKILTLKSNSSKVTDSERGMESELEVEQREAEWQVNGVGAKKIMNEIQTQRNTGKEMHFICGMCTHTHTHKFTQLHTLLLPKWIVKESKAVNV